MKNLLIAALLFTCSICYGGITSILIENDSRTNEFGVPTNPGGYKLKIYGLQSDGKVTDAVLKTAAEKAKYPALESAFGLTPGKSLRCWFIFNGDGTVNRVDFQIKPEADKVVDEDKAKEDSISIIETTNPDNVGPKPLPEDEEIIEAPIP